MDLIFIFRNYGTLAKRYAKITHMLLLAMRSPFLAIGRNSSVLQKNAICSNTRAAELRLRWFQGYIFFPSWLLY
jgi:hypothetical protein